MPFGLVFRTNDGGRWGTGKGSNLSPTEVDLNFWAVAAQLQSIIDSPTAPNNIVSVTYSDGQLVFGFADASTLAVAIPTISFHWLGDWAAGVDYHALDVVRVSGQGLYLVTRNHTSDTTFNDQRLIDGGFVYILMFGVIDQPPDTYDIAFFFAPKLPPANKVLAQFVVPRAMTLPSALVNSQAMLRIATSADVSLQLFKNETILLGSIDFGAGALPNANGGQGATFTFAADITFNRGDRLSIQSPTIADLTAEGFSASLVANLG